MTCTFQIQVLLECLQSADASALQRHLDLFSETEFSVFPNPFVPVVDQGHCSDPVLPGLPEQLIRDKKFESVPAILGGNSHEGILMMGQFLAHPRLYANFTESMPLLLFNVPQAEVDEGDKALVEAVKR